MTSIVQLPRTGRFFNVDVLNVEYYQEFLALLAGQYSPQGVFRLVDAQLVPENNNPYDSNAVRVDIGGQRVGYLSPTNALAFRRHVKDDSIGVCPAVVYGGWYAPNAPSNLGVSLDLKIRGMEERANWLPYTIPQQPIQKQKIGCLGWIGIAIIALMAFGLLSSLGRRSESADIQNRSAKVAAPAVQQGTAAVTRVDVGPTPTPSLTFDAICEPPDTMTDVQIEQYLKSFEGKQIADWQGWVYDVHANYGGNEGYTLLIAMDPPGFLWTRNIEIADIPADLAVRLQKKQKLVFSGTISAIGRFLGSNCNPMVIENAEIRIN